MLKQHTFIDLSIRLPGPLAGKILADLGATVIKVEDANRKDPFLTTEFDPSFEHWYNELNRKKQVLRFDFKDPGTKDKIQELVQGASGIILSLPAELKKNLGLDSIDLPIAVVELEASKSQNKALHDLNALALTGLLSLHVAHQNAQIVDPPFLPIAGIAFGQAVATQMLANMIEARDKKKCVRTVSFLYETVEQVLGPFWSQDLQSHKKSKFLHNGAYPCYSLYRLRDGNYLAVAAIEERYWSNLIETFKIPLPLERRFETNEEAFNAVAQSFAKMDAKEIEIKAQNKELCISIVRKFN